MKKGKTGPAAMDPKRTYINPEEEDQMEIWGYRRCRFKVAVTWFFILITAGILRLAFHWMPRWFLKCTHKRCHLSEADSVLLKDQYLQWFVSEVRTTTKDGTSVKVLKQTTTFTFSAKKRQRRSQLLLQPDQTACKDGLNGAVCGPLLTKTLSAGARDENLIRYFVVKKVKYIWDPDEDVFIKLRGLDVDSTCSYFHAAKGLSVKEQRKRRVLYGSNSIDVHVTPILVLLFKEALTPFYIFQVFSCVVWFSDEYYYYASCIVLISFVSLSATIYQTRKMQRALRNTIQTAKTVNVCRGDNDYQEISSEDLVPGDVVEIPASGCDLQFDAVLISGNCIVNESMLTGESVPVTKTPLPNPKYSATQQNEKFNLKEHSKHTLFCGTHVIQTRYYGNQKVKAVVVRTGFQTAKGELVRAILYPKPVDFKFNRDTYFFVGVLAVIAGVGFVYTIVIMVGREEPVFDIVKRSLDLITIAVPPALPAALTVGIVFAQSRLKRSKIYCISPRSINVCGTINAICFDKTGTLTEDGLNMQGVMPVEDGRFEDEIINMSLLPRGPLIEAMATCHSLTIMDGKLSGDPLDLIMFEAVGWDLEEQGSESSRFDMIVPTIVSPKYSADYTMSAEELAHMERPGEDVGIVRQFTFSSSLQRMSVITRRLGADNFDLYTKGSPEMVASLSKPETVPVDFHEVLSSYTQHGYRVLALAWRKLPAKLKYVKVQRIQREEVEKNLTFLGLLVMENKLKIETTPIIDKLRSANIRTVMVTGDNILTALSVARECHMVNREDKIILVEAYIPAGDIAAPQVQFSYVDNQDQHVQEVYLQKDEASIRIDECSKKFHFATTGRSWAILRQYFPEELAKVLVRGVVFARMSPEQKAQLVEALQELGYFVGMCGDGANDCGALKTAHTGISLSEAEASVASPFTSKNPNIECVPTVIREGRAALVTSFGIFKYMACYSLTQFVSVLILYHIGANLTDFEFLYIDLFLLTSLSVTFGRTEPFPVLVKNPPMLSLTSPGPILSIILQMGTQMAAQVFCYFNVQEQPWFEPYVDNFEDDHMSYENTAIFSISAYQYIILAVAFSKGAPYRKHMFSNYLFLLNIFICVAFTMWLTIYPLPFMVDFFELRPPPSVPYRLIFFGIASANALLSIIIETFLLDHAVIRKKVIALKERCFPSFKYQYSAIEDDIVATPTWPPINHSSTGFYRLESCPSPDEIAKETDRMLPNISDLDLSTSCSPVSSPSKGRSLQTSFEDSNLDITNQMCSAYHGSASGEVDRVIQLENALQKEENSLSLQNKAVDCLYGSHSINLQPEVQIMPNVQGSATHASNTEKYDLNGDRCQGDGIHDITDKDSVSKASNESLAGILTYKF